MILNKEFLQAALPHATFVYGDKTLAVQDPGWAELESKGEVTVAIDSRAVLAREFFIALKGQHVDGHDFIADALNKGAAGILMAQARKNDLENLSDLQRKNRLFVMVDDPAKAFLALAKTWRAQLTCPIIGITGSVGKTSTKEMLRTLLQTAGMKAYVSFKNYNNELGLSYNILRVPLAIDVAVFEVGINEVGEMAVLADILRPTIGVVTNAGHAHLKGLGNSLATVAFEKRQLFKFFTSQEVGIVFGDQPLLNDVSYAHPIARFGLKTKNQVQARKIHITIDNQGVVSTHFMFKWYRNKATIVLRGCHQAMVANALAASTVAYFLDIPFQKVVDGLLAYRGFEERFEMKKLRNNKGMLLSDCYNANPESMKAAIVAFGQMPAKGRKIAVLGDMLELGIREAYWHRQMGRVVSKVKNIDSLILVGQLAPSIAKTVPLHLPVICVKNWQEAIGKLEEQLIDPDAMVLVKASHKMELERLVHEVVEK